MEKASALGRYIRERRQELDLSLREFARRTKRSAAFISDIELGRIYPTEATLTTIARILGDSMESLKSRAN
jgi:transcriptional regulator with XRE-family HTH domain